MIVYKIHNVENFDDAKPIIEALEDFNKDKSAIWVPKEWAHVEGIGDFEKTTVISVINNKKPIKAENIKQFLQDAYDKLGGEDFLKEKEVYLPGNLIEIEVLEKTKPLSDVKPKTNKLVFKVKTDGLSVDHAFDLVRFVRDNFDERVINKNTPIFIPDSILDVEFI